MSVRKLLTILTLIMIATVAVVAVVRAQQTGSQIISLPGAQSGETYVVQRGSVQESVDATGTVKADQIVNVGFLTSGQVQEIDVHEGDYVAAGTPLVRLDNARQKLNVDRARLGAQFASVDLEDVQIVDDKDVRVAESQLQAARSSYQSVVKAVSDEDIKAAELAYEKAQQAYVAANQARQNADGSKAYIASLNAAIGQTSFQMEIARLRLEDLKTSTQGDLGAAAAAIRQAELHVTQVASGPTPYQVEQKQVALDQASVGQKQSELLYSYTLLTAPVDGIVNTVNVELGERVQAGRPVIQMADIDPLEVIVNVDEIDVHALRVGMPAVIKFDALPGLFLTGSVKTIPESGSKINGVVKYAVHLSLDIADARLRHGMTAKTSIIVQDETNAISVPTRLVQHDANGDYVTVVHTDGSREHRALQLGMQGDDSTEVLSGLSVGDVITQ